MFDFLVVLVVVKFRFVTWCFTWFCCFGGLFVDWCVVVWLVRFVILLGVGVSYVCMLFDLV